MFITSSQVNDPTHWFYKLRESTSTYYKSVDFEKICHECQKLKPSEAILCETKGHIKIKATLLKDKEKILDIAQGVSTNIKKTLIEEYNLFLLEDLCPFQEYEITSLFNSKNMIKDKTIPDSYLMAIDPSYGGSNDTAIVVMAIIKGQYVIVYVDYQNTARQLFPFIMSSIYNFHKVIRKNAKIPLVVAIESISRIDGTRLEQDIKSRSDIEFENVHLIRDEQKIKKRGYEEAMSGTNLGAVRKEDMLHHLQILMETNSIKIHSECSTQHEDGIVNVLNELKNQMKRFKHFDKKVSLKLNGTAKTTKNNTGKEGLLNDDLIIALLMACYWIRRFNHNDHYLFQRSEIKRIKESFT